MSINNNTASRGLFINCFIALVATAFCFILRAFAIDDWGHEFALSETQKGELLGVGLWPFAISIVLLSLVIDRLGFKFMLWLAAICHLTGFAIIMTASGYWGLYVGTFILSIGNGTVEAAINPLIATAFRDNKTTWLNRLHAGWPGGLVLGGLLSLMLGTSVSWRIKMALIVIPVIIYAVMLMGRQFPRSERVAAGVAYRDMLAEAGFLSALIVVALMVLEIGRVFGLPMMLQLIIIAALSGAYAAWSRSIGRPLFIVMTLVMIPLATTELGTDSWITSLMEPQMTSLGLQAGWVLVYTALIVLVLRFVAGPLIHRWSPLGLLAISAAVAAIGLVTLSMSSGFALLIAATIYGLGKSFFWPTSLGVVAEQCPKGGAVTLNVVAGVGMLAAGIVGSVLLGAIQDHAVSNALRDYDTQHATQLHATLVTQEKRSILGTYLSLDQNKLAASDAATQKTVNGAINESKRTALHDVAILPVVMLMV
ncbi:MAG: MFS transporter, partial [Steroidobacter sp.]